MSLNDSQPPPKPSEWAASWDLVIEDMRERDTIGTERYYGQRLRPFNGRDPLIDAYQEALDMPVYLRAYMEQRKEAVRCLLGIRSLSPQWSDEQELYLRQAFRAMGLEA